MNILRHLNACKVRVGLKGWRFHLVKERPNDCEGNESAVHINPPHAHFWFDPKVVKAGGLHLLKLEAHELAHVIVYPLAHYTHAITRHKEYATELEEQVCDHLEEILYRLLPSVS